MLRAGLAFLRRLGFDYACFRIYVSPPAEGATGDEPEMFRDYRVAEIAAADLERSPHVEIRQCVDYLGPDAVVYGAYGSDGDLSCVQCFWFGERYRKISFWPLEADEAASMHLVTAPPAQGKGLATFLKRETAAPMRQRGFSRLYSRIWWTNHSSLRVSEKAGWSHVGTIIEVVLPGVRSPLRVVRRKAGAPGFKAQAAATDSRPAR